jgi:pterin-4a-carbinolamine dehydratase
MVLELTEVTRKGDVLSARDVLVAKEQDAMSEEEFPDFLAQRRVA